MAHFGSFWLILAHFGSFWLILAHFGLNLSHFGSLSFIFCYRLAHFGSFWLILAHFGSLSFIFCYRLAQFVSFCLIILHLFLQIGSFWLNIWGFVYSSMHISHLSQGDLSVNYAHFTLKSPWDKCEMCILEDTKPQILSQFELILAHYPSSFSIDWLILAHFGSFWLILAHFGLNWLIILHLFLQLISGCAYLY